MLNHVKLTKVSSLQLTPAALDQEQLFNTWCLWVGKEQIAVSRQNTEENKHVLV
jgi:hypothetical protein